eukprot:gene15620-4698_t
MTIELRQMNGVSKIAAVLTAGGVVPFVALSKPAQSFVDANAIINASGIQGWMGRKSLNSKELQVTYGAVILSFVGAPHWGMAMSQPSANLRWNAARLVWGVIPSLIAWPCASMPTPKSQNTLSVGLALAFAMDIIFAAKGLTPRGYLLLRAPPTLIGIMALQTNVS